MPSLGFGLAPSENGLEKVIFPDWMDLECNDILWHQKPLMSAEVILNSSHLSCGNIELV